MGTDTLRTDTASGLRVYVEAIPRAGEDATATFQAFALFVGALDSVLRDAFKASDVGSYGDVMVRRVHLASPLVIEVVLASGASVAVLAALLKQFKRLFSFDLELRTERQEWKNRFEEAERVRRRAAMEEAIERTSKTVALAIQIENARASGNAEEELRLHQELVALVLVKVGQTPNAIEEIQEAWVLREAVVTVEDEQDAQG